MDSRGLEALSRALPLFDELAREEKFWNATAPVLFFFLRLFFS